MRIAIVGAGVAGSYLHALLTSNTNHSVDIYDAMPIRGRGCAWAVPEAQFRDLVKEVCLNPSDYILSRVSKTDSQGVIYKLNNMVVINKPRLLSDLVKPKAIKISEVASPPTGYDLVVDATGFRRVLLGPPKGPHVIAPCVQLVSEVPTLEEDQAAAALSPYGYAWAMPLGRGRYHYGAGAIAKDHVHALLRKLESRHPRRRDYCYCEKSVLASSPSLLEPKVKKAGGLVVVGVGEAVGTTCPVSYEGIVPAMKSAKLLAESVDDLSSYVSTLQSDPEFTYNGPLLTSYLEYLRSRFIKSFKLLSKMPKGRYGSEIGKFSKLKLTFKMLLALWST